MGLRHWKLIAVIGAAGLAGCGSSGPTLTIPTVASNTASLPASATTQATTPPPASNYPVVNWKAGEWPFSVQLIDITKNPEGYAGAGSAPPEHTWLMVRVSVTSTTPDRDTSAPTPELRCTAPNSNAWNANDANTVTPEQDGYEEQAGSRELTQAADVGMSPGQAHIWAAEWEAPEDTNTESVICGIVSNREVISLM